MKKIIIVLGIAFVFTCGIFTGRMYANAEAANKEPTYQDIAEAYIADEKPESIYDEIVIDDDRDTGHGVLTHITLYNEGKFVDCFSINMEYYGNLYF